MTRWEYRTHSRIRVGGPELLYALDEAGLAGWELVQINYSPWCDAVFKRPLLSDNTEQENRT